MALQLRRIKRRPGHPAKAIAGKVHMHDLHATNLHQLGLNHEQLTYRYTGRDFRLTDVHGRVTHEVLGNVG